MIYIAIINAGALKNIKMIDDAVDKLLENDSTKSNYLNLANAVNIIFKAILPDPKASEFQQIVRLIKVIADKIRSY